MWNGGHFINLNNQLTEELNLNNICKQSDILTKTLIQTEEIVLGTTQQTFFGTYKNKILFTRLLNNNTDNY